MKSGCNGGQNEGHAAASMEDALPLGGPTVTAIGPICPNCGQQHEDDPCEFCGRGESLDDQPHWLFRDVIE